MTLSIEGTQESACHPASGKIDRSSKLQLNRCCVFKSKLGVRVVYNVSPFSQCVRPRRYIIKCPVCYPSATHKQYIHRASMGQRTTCPSGTTSLLALAVVLIFNH